MSSDNVNEGTKFAFDLNLEPVDETLDINVDHVDEENRDALNPVDEENHNSMNHVDEENHDSLNPIDEEIRDSPNDSYTPGDLDSCSICRGTLVNESDIQRTLQEMWARKEIISKINKTIEKRLQNKAASDTAGAGNGVLGRLLEEESLPQMKPPRKHRANEQEEHDRLAGGMLTWQDYKTMDELCCVCLPGDYGFDPLGLSDPEGTGGFIEPRWLAYGEIINVLADPVNNNVLTSLKFH
ncbi:unnamed protein product [Arabidopsis lyrata]|nr:unnamed protein product [Arabidopsis lyrata]